jgi:hypothetical protein
MSPFRFHLYYAFICFALAVAALAQAAGGVAGAASRMILNTRQLRWRRRWR